MRRAGTATQQQTERGCASTWHRRNDENRVRSTELIPGGMLCVWIGDPLSVYHELILVAARCEPDGAGPHAVAARRQQAFRGIPIVEVADDRDGLHAAGDVRKRGRD